MDNNLAEEEYESIEKDYNIFYKEPVTELQVFYIYVDKTNNIQDIIYEDLYLDKPNTIPQEVLIQLITQNTDYNNIKYKLISLLTYNINLSPEQLKKYVTDTSDQNFLTSNSKLSTIVLQDSILMFHDLNSLFLVFYENPKKMKQTNTKKIYYNPSIRKTKRKTT
jgi:hypothetical protein